MTLAPVTRLVRAAPSRAGQAEVQLAAHLGPASATSGSSLGFPGTVGQSSAAGQSSPASVIGKDTRKRVTNTKAYPFRAITLLEVTYKTGATATCTGFLYAANIVATAGHCVFDSGDGRITKAVVIPANNATARPYGSCVGTTAISVTGWANRDNIDYDCGAIAFNNLLAWH
jgi:V8-like Glu-specific endopeptidase